MAVARNPEELRGKQIRAAADYYTPAQIMAEFQEVTVKTGRYVQLDQDVYRSFIPPPIAQELLENELLCEDPGYFAGGSFAEGHELLAKVGLAPTTWKDFLRASKDTFA